MLFQVVLMVSVVQIKIYALGQAIDVRKYLDHEQGKSPSGLLLAH